MKPSPKKSDPQNRPQIARIPTLAYDVTYNRDFLNAVAAQYFPSGGLKRAYRAESTSISRVAAQYFPSGGLKPIMPCWLNTSQMSLQRSTSPPGD